MVERFRTTRWSLIVAAGGDDEHADAALAELCEAYWRPVYAFVRRHGHTTEAAADLTQAFFLHLLQHRGFERADQSRGRFRNYLLASVHNFLVSARLHDRTLRRGADIAHESVAVIDLDRCPQLNAQDLESSPDAVFERQWALDLTERALEKLRAEYASRGQSDLFADLRRHLTSAPEPPRSSPADLPAVARGDMAYRTALHRARRRFGEMLRDEIRETLDDRGDVDDELRFLLQVLAR
jgi:RNA polymerase sigma-70 factor (ECF subfamily)